MDAVISRIKFGVCYETEVVNELAVASFGYIERDMLDIRKSYISLGFHLSEMKRSRYYVDLGYEDFYECVDKNFHMNKSAVSRCINVWEEFSDSGKMWLAESYKDYTYSQLVEMLPLKPEQRQCVTADMSVAQIRQFKKSLKEPKEKKLEKTTGLEGEEVTRLQPLKIEDGCPPENKNCIRQEWGEEVEEQKKKRQECLKEIDKEVAISQQEEIKHRELEADQPKLPDLKNMDEREKFIDGYKDWNIWCKNELTEETFYRYDLPDGAAIVVKSYPYYYPDYYPGWEDKDIEEKRFYLLKPGYHHFASCKVNMTILKEYLKKLRKKK